MAKKQSVRSAITPFVVFLLLLAAMVGYMVAFFQGTENRSKAAEYSTPQQILRPPGIFAITGLSLLCPSQVGIRVTWSDYGAESGYKVARCTGLGCTPTAIIATLPANTTSYSDYGDGVYFPGRSWSYRVVATRSEGVRNVQTTTKSILYPTECNQ